MVNVDVVSLFTNVPIHKPLNIVRNKLYEMTLFEKKQMKFKHYEFNFINLHLHYKFKQEKCSKMLYDKAKLIPLKDQIFKSKVLIRFAKKYTKATVTPTTRF